MPLPLPILLLTLPLGALARSDRDDLGGSVVPAINQDATDD